MNTTDCHHLLHGLLAPETRSDEHALVELRKELVARGVNSRGWRMFLEYGDALLRPLGPLIRSRSAERNLRNAISFLRLLQAGEMDVAPHREFVSVLCKVRFPLEGLEALPSNLFRSAWKECARRAYVGEDLISWLNQEVVPVFDWYLTVAAAPDEEGSGRRAVGWSTHLRRWSHWHEEPASPQGSRRWRALLPVLKHGPFVVRELCDEVSLFHEGAAMSHCVGGYVSECLLRYVHVFSITDQRTGARIATLALEPESDGEWGVNDLKGAHNASITRLRGIDDVVMALLRCIEDQIR